MKKCKHCGTTENLTPRSRKGDEVVYSNICYSCSNEKKKKHRCRHCGTTENLIFKKVMNQHLKEPKFVSQDWCYACRAKLSSVAHKGKELTEETKEKLRQATNELFQDIEYCERHRNGQKKRYEREDQRSSASENGKKAWEDPEFRKRKSKESKEQWKDPIYLEKMSEAVSNRLKKSWKDPEYRSRMMDNSKEYWSDTEKRKIHSEKCKIACKNRSVHKSGYYIMHASKPQQELFDVVKTYFPNALDRQSIPTNVSRRYPDIVVKEFSLIIEYDSSYFHDREEDKLRDEELSDVGFRVLHYVDYVPSFLKLHTDIRNFILSKESSLYVTKV